MKLAALLIVLAAGAPARADGFYFAEGAGTFVARGRGHGFHARWLVGRHVDDWTVETFLQLRALGSCETVGYGVGARKLFPASEHVTLYLRGDVRHERLSTTHAKGPVPSGHGVGFGAGAMVSGRVRALGLLFWPLFFAGTGPKVTASAWIDAGGSHVRYRFGSDLETRAWSAGVSVGGSF